MSHSDSDEHHEEVELRDAARRLGLSLGAIRKRLQRKTLSGHIAPNGRWYVYLPIEDGGVGRPKTGIGRDRTDETTAPSAPPAAFAQEHDRQDQPATELYERLLAAREAEIGRLVDQLEEKDQQLRRRDDELRRAQEAEGEQRRIIAGLMARLPELAAPTPRPDAPGDAPTGAPSPVVAAGPGRERRERRPWWRPW